MPFSDRFMKSGADVPSRGLLASIARLAYQIPEADRPNKTMIVMVLLLLKYGLALS